MNTDSSDDQVPPIASTEEPSVRQTKPPFFVRNIELFSTELTQLPGFASRATKENSRYTLGAVINNVSHFDETSCIAFVDFSAGREIEGERAYELRASYLLVLEAEEPPSEPTWRSYLELVASTSAWLLFKGLFSVAVTQADLDLPKLPARPQSLEFDEN